MPPKAKKGKKKSKKQLEKGFLIIYISIQIIKLLNRLLYRYYIVLLERQLELAAIAAEEGFNIYKFVLYLDINYFFF